MGSHLGDSTTLVALNSGQMSRRGHLFAHKHDAVCSNWAIDSYTNVAGNATTVPLPSFECPHWATSSR
jgi:hypothetical protein